MTPGPAQPLTQLTWISAQPDLTAFSLADAFAASQPTSPRPAWSPPTSPRPAPAGAESPPPLLAALEDFPPWGLAAAAVIADAMGGGAVGRWQAQLSAAALPPDGCEDGLGPCVRNARGFDIREMLTRIAKAMHMCSRGAYATTRPHAPSCSGFHAVGTCEGTGHTAGHRTHPP
jgi:hypothetical protein